MKYALSLLVVTSPVGGFTGAGSLLHAQDNLQRIEVNGALLEYEVSGQGEPVLMIHGTGVAATFAPTMSAAALDQYRLIRFHRRGFAGSDRAPVPFTTADQAQDARRLLEVLGIEKAHIVGHSYGATVALQLALDNPEVVHSLVVIEPPVFNPDAPPGAFSDLDATYRSGDRLGAMNTFSIMSYGQDWRTLAARVPGGPDQVENDAATVFDSEMPAMTSWRFDADIASGISQPITYLSSGTGHGASLGQLEMWIDGLESEILDGLTHAMLMEDPPRVADAIARFLVRHAF